ncbi:hypothetical protein ACFWGD_08505 [Corynebacterium sp. NPDC060344]|uniref:hypothetical protein n=1 Tax=Corynebacterium sp. NPDC060344 TaxID=3347101 RepID=UPI0036619C13
MTVRRPALRRPDDTIEAGMLKAATLAMACAWPLWLFERIALSYPGSLWLEHWFPTVTALMFAVSNLLMFLAWMTGRSTTMILANRIAGFSVPMAMVLVVIALAQGDAGPRSAIWFTGFVGVPAVAFALTVPLRLGLPWFVFTVGGVTLANAMLQGRTQWDELTGEIGFSLINTFAFVVFAAAAMRVSRVTDSVEERARRDHARAATLRAREKEMTRFTALVHDHVLSELAAISGGLKPTGTVDLRFGSGLAAASGVGADRLIEMIAECVHRESPDCDVIVERRCGSESTEYPEPMVSNLMLSLAETARNSAKHAGAGARRRCAIDVDDASVRVVYSDDGEGFRLSDVDDTRAGLRISVLGRMASVEGGSADVSSMPGRGTEVTLSWAGEDRADVQPPLPEGANDEPLTSILGMNIVYSWQFGLMIVLVVALINFAGGHFFGWAELAYLALIIVAVLLLMPGDGPTLSRVRTAGLVAVAALLAAIGQWQHVIAFVGEWERLIFLNMIALLASLVAIRGRPGGALLMVLSAATIAEVLTRVPGAPAPDIDAVTVLSFSILVAAAALVNWGVAFFFRRLPKARTEQMAAAADAATAVEQKERRRDNLSWLEREIRPVIDAARVVHPATDRLRLRARLTELRLRDVLRSPLLDVPALRTAIWDARSRGVEVRLLDDRTGWSRDAGDDEEAVSDDVHAPSAVDANLGAMISALDHAVDGDAVTIRLSPPHRAVFATISDESGVARLAADGGRL